jgi:hypothetical protein
MRIGLTDHDSSRSCESSAAIDSPVVDTLRGRPIFDLGEMTHLGFFDVVSMNAKMEVQSRV